VGSWHVAGNSLGKDAVHGVCVDSIGMHDVGVKHAQCGHVLHGRAQHAHA
jgi:hypothetical protein